MSDLGGVQQLGFVTDNIDRAARRWLKHLEAGPFFFVRGVRFEGWTFYGAPQDLTLDIAFVQSGEIMVEFIQPNGAWPNVYGQRAPDRDTTTLHHHGYLVNDMAAAATRLDSSPLVTSATIGPDAELRYYDMRAQLGVFIELIQDGEAARGFFDLARQSAVAWDGSEPFRELVYADVS